jgi:lipopolysaccharide/colanic/teichoic acid biosynthesis glycosyltransferase
MTRSIVILDAHTETVGTARAAGGCSVLLLPYGRRNVWAQIERRIACGWKHATQPWLIIPQFEPPPDYAAELAEQAAVPVRVITHDELAAELKRRANDSEHDVLVLDASRWPVQRVDSAPILSAYTAQRGPLHVIATGPRTGRAQERVERDDEGQVKRVQRAFGPVLDPEVAARGALLTLLPAKSLAELKFASVSALRDALTAHAITARDHAVSIPVLDLRTTDGVLALTTQSIERTLARRPGGRKRGSQSSALVGGQCKVDPTARLVGPVVLHERVTIGRDVTIVGPALIGADVVIEDDAVIAQAVVTAGTRVGRGVTLRHCVARGECTISSAGVQTQLEPTQLRSVVSTPGLRLSRRVQFALKRGMDIIASGLGLLVLAPLLIVLAIAVKLSSAGPLFFIHRRERADGKEFGCVKFRTMQAGADKLQQELLERNEVDGPQFKLRHDPRVTKLGAWMRTTNLDELPQLFNVLAGHMSLVGPRPSPFGENQICVPWRRARLSVRPGITGLWQICRSADRSCGDFHEWIFYDMAYVRNFSLWLDMKILVATVLTLGGRNSVRITRLIPNLATEPAPAESLAT